MPCPPAETTTYCLPFEPRYVIGVERALVGSAPFQSSTPLWASKAYSAGSSVPAMNTTPPAVTIGPPNETDPHWPASGIFSVPMKRPSGVSHLTSPELPLIAASVPHGGRLQGR